MALLPLSKTSLTDLQNGILSCCQNLSLSHPKNGSLVIPPKLSSNPVIFKKNPSIIIPFTLSKSPLFQKILSTNPLKNGTLSRSNPLLMCSTSLQMVWLVPLRAPRLLRKVFQMTISWAWCKNTPIDPFQKSSLTPLTLFSFISLKLHQTPLSQSIRGSSNQSRWPYQHGKNPSPIQHY